MDFPQLQIRTTDTVIDLQIQDPVQNIRQPKAKQTIQQPAAILEINTTPGKLNIDSSQARRDLGLLGPLESIDKYAKDGKQAALKGMARRVREGRQMMINAGKGMGNQTIKNIAKQNHGPKIAPINIKFVPSVGSVKIDYTPGKLDIKAVPQKPIINTQINRPINEYIPGKITTDVLQRASIEIDFIG